MKRIYFLSLLALPLAACASLDEDACRSGDWAEIGFRDGTRGRDAAFIQNHAQACAEYGIAPDPAAWNAGRVAGLRQYCTPRNAYEEGTRGRRLRDVCTGPDAAQLERLNDRGRKWHRIGRDISEVLRDIDVIDARLADLAADAPERAALLADRRALRRDLFRLRMDQRLYRY